MVGPVSRNNHGDRDEASLNAVVREIVVLGQSVVIANMTMLL